MISAVVGAHWPWFLALLPILGGALVYIFRARGQGQARVISSLFILNKLPTYQPQRKRFVPPLLFWLELLACVFLTLAISGIYTSEVGERIAVVIDVSKSMATRQSSTDTKLSEAIRLAGADIAQSSSDSRFSLFTAARSLMPLDITKDSLNYNFKEQTQLSPKQAIGRINSISQSYYDDDIQSVINGLARSKEYDAVLVYTDKVVNIGGIDAKIRVTTISADVESQSNIWLSSARIVPDKTEDKKIEVTLGSAGSGRARVKLSASCVDNSAQLVELKADREPRFGDKRDFGPVVLEAVELGSYVRAEIAGIALPAANTGYCEISTEMDRVDAIALDNRGWVSLGSAPNEIKLYTNLVDVSQSETAGVASSRLTNLNQAHSAAAQLGLADLPYGRIVSGDTGSSSQVVNAIYHRTPPKSGLSGAALIVYPPSGTEIIDGIVGNSASVRGAGVEITRWLESHPVLRYVQPQLISIPRANLIKCPSQAVPIIFSSLGPIACAGEDSGLRYVITGFELFPFDGLQTPALSIFTLNAMRWLFQEGGGGTPDGARIGLVKLPVGVQSALLVGPEERALSNTLNQTLLVTEPGIIAIERLVDGSKQRVNIAVNSFSDEESDTSHLGTVTVPLSSSKEVDSLNQPGSLSKDTHSLERIFCLFFVIVLALDLVRRVLGRKAWGGTT